MPRPARLAPVLLMFLLGSACSGVPPSKPLPPEGSLPTLRILANGVRVVVQEFRASDVVAVQLWVGVGSRDEATPELGLAHYLEHMLFKGTVSRAPGFVDREVEGVGGRINAGTSLDYTYYHTVLPAPRAVAAIEMLADMSVNSTLQEQTLDLEKRVVLEEMRLGEDNPRRHLSRRLHELLFDGHPYGRPVIGIAEIIQGLTRDTLVGFYRRHYVPESFVLVVVGPVRAPEVLSAAERTLGWLPRSGLKRFPPSAPAAVRSRRLEVERPGTQAYLGLAWLGPKLDHADTPVVDLLASILGQSRSSRLSQALREKLGLVSSVSASYTALETAGAVTITAQLEPANLARVEAEILKELERVSERGVTGAELRRAVTAAEARYAFLTETAEGRAYTFGRAETVWRLEEELAYVDRLRSVTREQIRSAARRYLDPQRCARVAFVPPSR
jgi:zinc protease